VPPIVYPKEQGNIRLSAAILTQESQFIMNIIKMAAPQKLDALHNFQSPGANL